MSLPNYSEDTFTSVTEDEDERQYEDDSFEPYDSLDEWKEPAASDLAQSTWQPSCQKDEELLDSAFVVGESLTRKWINLLKVNRTTTITERAEPSTEPDTALPGISEEELGALQSFCVSKIYHLHHQRVSEPLRRNSGKEQRPRMVSRRQQTGGYDSAAPPELVNRLHLRNLKERMEKIAEMEMHQPSQCPFCMKKRAGFAKVEFLRRKKTILDNVLLQEKLEDYMYTKDSLTLIGEIHKSLPKLSEDPSNIWQELNKRASIYESSRSPGTLRPGRRGGPAPQAVPQLTKGIPLSFGLQLLVWCSIRSHAPWLLETWEPKCL